MSEIFAHNCPQWRSLDYVAGWFMKAANYSLHTATQSAFVTTNSICQGQQVALLWPLVFAKGQIISFAYTSFKWSNLASHNAGVTVAIVGLASENPSPRRIFSIDDNAQSIAKFSKNISPYLIDGPNVFISKITNSLSNLPKMTLGNVPYDGGALLIDRCERDALLQESMKYAKFIKKFYGSAEFIRGIQRYCLWITDENLDEAMKLPQVAARVSRVRQMRLSSNDAGTRSLASRSHQMREMNKGRGHTIVVPRVSSENRPYLPVGLADSHTVIGDKNYAAYDAPYWIISLIASRMHLVWIATVCVRLRTDFSYGSTLGWNTFPVPSLTERNKADLTRCAEEILLVREAHFPATIADLYDPEKMPADLRAAHDRNDETLERIYLGRRFKNDTERLEKLFELYTKMTTNAPTSKKAAKRKTKAND